MWSDQPGNSGLGPALREGPPREVAEPLAGRGTRWWTTARGSNRMLASGRCCRSRMHSSVSSHPWRMRRRARPTSEKPSPPAKTSARKAIVAPRTLRTSASRVSAFPGRCARPPSRTLPGTPGACALPAGIAAPPTADHARVRERCHEALEPVRLGESRRRRGRRPPPRSRPPRRCCGRQRGRAPRLVRISTPAPRRSGPDAAAPRCGR